MNQITTVNNLTPERQKLLEVLSQGKFDSVTDLCAAAGVTRNVYYSALKSEDFVEQLFASSTGAIYASVPTIVEKIIKQAKLGSYMHQKMLLEMVKLYQVGPQIAVQVNNYQATPEDMEEAVFAWLKDNPGKWEKVKEVMQ